MQIESSIYNVYGYTIIFVHLHSFNFFVYYAFRTSNISTRFNTPTTFSTFSFCRMSIRIYPFLWKLKKVHREYLYMEIYFGRYFSLRIFPYPFCPFKFPTNARSLYFMFYYTYIYIIYIFTCCVQCVHFYPFKLFTNLDLPSTSQSPENIRLSIDSANVVDSSKFIQSEASQTTIMRAIYFERSITSHRTYTLRSFTFQINYTFPCPFPGKRGSSTNKQP